MTAVATPDAARLVFAAVAGLILLLVLIIKFKVHAMISILIGAVGIGLMAGMPLSDIIGSVNEGIGNTLKGIALLVGLGSMFGAILEESGGAQTLAVTMVRKFGDEKAAWALGITGLVVAMPVFFDAGLIIQLIAKCTWVIKLFRFHHTIIHIAHTIMRIIRVRIRPHQSIARLTSLLVCQINIFQHIRLLMPPHIAQQSTIIGTYN